MSSPQFAQATTAPTPLSSTASFWPQFKQKNLITVPPWRNRDTRMACGGAGVNSNPAAREEKTRAECSDFPKERRHLLETVRLIYTVCFSPFHASEAMDP